MKPTKRTRKTIDKEIVGILAVVGLRPTRSNEEYWERVEDLLDSDNPEKRMIGQQLEKLGDEWEEAEWGD